jgi:isoleucyl-tRNA synthetase
LKQKKSGKQIQTSGPIYDALGPDALRLWVASSDYTRDVAIGQQVLQTVNTSLHKYRVTLKVLLGALNDFTPGMIVPYSNLHNIDHIALAQLANLVDTCRHAYDNFEFYRVVNAINRWANFEFSAFYMETLKDRLYTDSENSTSRRAAQSTLYHMLRYLQETLAPITPLLVEESWEHNPSATKAGTENPHQRVASTPPAEWRSPELESEFTTLMAVNGAIKALQETARTKKEMGSSLQSFVHIALPTNNNAPELRSLFAKYRKELSDFFVVSSVTLGIHDQVLPEEIETAQWKYSAEVEFPVGWSSQNKTTDDATLKGTVYVYTPQQDKCPRCWKYNVPPSTEGVTPLSDGAGSPAMKESKEDSHEEKKLCRRCSDVVSSLNSPLTIIGS